MELTIQGANATVITVGKDKVLFSYSTPVAALIDGTRYRSIEKYSNTTQKHITQFFGFAAIGKEKPQEWFNSLLITNVNKDIT